MDLLKYYQKNETYISYKDYRIKKILKIVEKLRPLKVLDIGCGNGLLIKEIQKLFPLCESVGIDVYSASRNAAELPFIYHQMDITKGININTDNFDLVILGEVIEHVPDPDFLLREVNRMLGVNGYLIVSTPNLVSWANRLLILFGIQPLYTETSSEVNLGRYYRFLGQNKKTQGHLKIFTHKSLEEILIKEKYVVESKHGVNFFFPFPISLIDTVVSRLNIVPISSGLLYLVKKAP